MISIKRDKLIAYCSQVPLALALERSVESAIFRKTDLKSPILDLGCGDGIFASQTFDFKLDYGVDPNQRELNRAKKTGIYNSLLNTYGSSIPLPDNSVQTVISNSVLEHIKNLDEVMQEIYRILKPGGSIVFTVPSHQFDRYSNVNQILEFLGLEKLSTLFRNKYNWFWKHYNFMSCENWSIYIEKFGFKTVEVFTYNPKLNCQINDFLAPFGIFGKLSKVLFNRWTFFPKLRHVVLQLLIPALLRFVDSTTVNQDCGLVYIRGKKSDEN